jgi:hypothetical protein
MRSSPLVLILVVVASLLFCLAPASAWAQQLQCNPCSHAFGNVAAGASSTYSIELTNTGSTALSITYKSRGGNNVFWYGTFTLPHEIRPGASVELPVIFKPTADGESTGVMTLKNTAEDSSLSIDLTGTGVSKNSAAPALGVTPATLSFGSVTVGSSASLPATLKASNAAVTISSDASTSSEFVHISELTLPATIAAGDSVRRHDSSSRRTLIRRRLRPRWDSPATPTGSPTVAQVDGHGRGYRVPSSVALSWAGKRERRWATTCSAAQSPRPAPYEADQ